MSEIAIVVGRVSAGILFGIIGYLLLLHLLQFLPISSFAFNLYTSSRTLLQFLGNVDLPDPKAQHRPGLVIPITGIREKNKVELLPSMKISREPEQVAASEDEVVK